VARMQEAIEGPGNFWERLAFFVRVLRTYALVWAGNLALVKGLVAL